MKLPNGDRAVVDIEKLRGYCLNPTHVKGKHKARVFKAALGMTEDDAGRLREVLLNVARTGEARQGKLDAFGQHFVIEFPMFGPRGDVTVRSAWIILSGEDVPRLINCYIP